MDEKRISTGIDGLDEIRVDPTGNCRRIAVGRRSALPDLRKVRQAAVSAEDKVGGSAAGGIPGQVDGCRRRSCKQATHRGIRAENRCLSGAVAKLPDNNVGLDRS